MTDRIRLGGRRDRLACRASGSRRMVFVRARRALCLFCLPIVAAGAERAGFPEAPDPMLQDRLERVVAEAGLAEHVRERRLAVAVARLDDADKGTTLAMLNGHVMMYAASLPKIAILYGAAVALDEARVDPTPALQADMIAMIRRSCNQCATRVLEQVGREWLLDLLQSGHRFYDRSRGGGLWVGKDYARDNAFRRDPANGISHGATAWQAARWYYCLHRGELASAEQTALMLEALSEPAIPHKFVRGLREHDVVAMYRKSGTWRHFHADSALVVSEESGAYIVVGLARDSRGANWLERLADGVHREMVSLSRQRALPSEPATGRSSGDPRP